MLPGQPVSVPAPRTGRSGTILAGVVFALMISAIVYRYWPSDERSIRRHLSNLSESLSLPAGEEQLQRITRFSALREYFTEDVRITAGNRALRSREELLGVLQRVEPPPGGLHIEISDLTIAVADDRQTAAVTLTGRVSRKDSRTGETIVDEDAISLSMVNHHDDWVIASAETYPR